MTRHYFTPTILLGCILFVFGGLARAEVLQCVDDRGAVTYTNLPCENNTDPVPDGAVSSSALAKTKGGVSAAVTYTASEETHESAWAKRPASNSNTALDIETLKAARSSMLVRNQGSPRQEFVALDLRSQHWFDFR
jgi:hypothetical protein